MVKDIRDSTYIELADFVDDVNILLAPDSNSVDKSLAILSIATGIDKKTADGAMSMIAKASGKLMHKKFGSGVKEPLWRCSKNKSTIKNTLGHYKKHKSEFIECQAVRQRHKEILQRRAARHVQS